MAPSKLCISYDVTSIGGDLHVVAVYAHWLVRPQGLDDSATDFLATTKWALLAFSPMLDETKFDAAAQHEFLKKTVERYNKTEEDVLVTTGDNCSTNLATEFGTFFHRVLLTPAQACV